MSCTAASRVEALPAEVAVREAAGIPSGINACVGLLFKDAGDRCRPGSEVLVCHPEPSRTKFPGTLAFQTSNAYLNTNKGEKRFFFLSPWYQGGRFAGFAEKSFEVPGKIPQLVKE